MYRAYVALKAHFSNEDYDYIKFQGKTKASEKSLEKRNDKAFFYRLARNPDYENFLLANFLENKQIWIGELAINHTAENIYKDWLRRKQSISYIFSQDLNQLHDDFEKNFRIEDNQIPFVLSLFVQRKICIETCVILFDLIDYFRYLDKRLQDDLVYQGVRMRLRKYIPFLLRDYGNFEKFRNLSKARFVRN